MIDTSEASSRAIAIHRPCKLLQLCYCAPELNHDRLHWHSKFISFNKAISAKAEYWFSIAKPNLHQYEMVKRSGGVEGLLYHLDTKRQLSKEGVIPQSRSPGPNNDGHRNQNNLKIVDWRHWPFSHSSALEVCLDVVSNQNKVVAFRFSRLKWYQPLYRLNRFVCINR